MFRSIACAALAAAIPLAGSAALTVPSHFEILTVAQVPSPREMAILPDGRFIVGTRGRDLYLLDDPERGTHADATLFASLPDSPAAGVTVSARRSEIFVGTERGVYAIPYRSGDRTARAMTQIASVRDGPVAPNSDGDVHSSTSLAFDDPTQTLFVAVGSSCNACAEVDPSRASIFAMKPDGKNVVKRGKRFRNAIALAVDPRSGSLWAGGAGQDTLAFGHPYEFLDNVTAHAGIADYGWPECEESRHAYVTGADCSHTIAPPIVFPAYATLIGAVFYPAAQRGAYAFPARYRGAIFVTMHGSWHRSADGSYAAEPMVATVTMHGDRPSTPVDWQNPSRQWERFVGGFLDRQTREGRPTGIAVGSQGSLFVADDSNGVIYRVRPR